MKTVFAADTRISVRVITYEDKHKTFFIPLPDTRCILVLICALVPCGDTCRVVVSLVLKFMARLRGSRRKMEIIQENTSNMRLTRTGMISLDMRGLSKA